MSRISLVLGAQRRRCRKGIHVLGETREIGAGIKRTVCDSCGAVATIDLRGSTVGIPGDVDIPARKQLWQ